jgi:hypothetical protein
MKRLDVYIINIEEDLAEKAFLRAVDAVNTLNLIIVNPKSVVVEPHDDYRGVAATFKYSYLLVEAEQNKNASKGLQELMQSLIKAQLWNISAVKVLTETGESK